MKKVGVIYLLIVFPAFAGNLYVSTYWIKSGINLSRISKNGAGISVKFLFPDELISPHWFVKTSLTPFFNNSIDSSLFITTNFALGLSIIIFNVNHTKVEPFISLGSTMFYLKVFHSKFASYSFSYSFGLELKVDYLGLYVEKVTLMDKMKNKNIYTKIGLCFRLS